MRLLTVFLCSVMVSSCANQSGARMSFFSATAPVIAMMADDLFVGDSTSSVDGTGVLALKSAVNPNLTCIGNYHREGSASGSGKATCNDGTEAKFQFQNLTALSGYGFGTTSRGPMSFTFGLTPDQSIEYLKLPVNKRIQEDHDSKKIELVPI